MSLMMAQQRASLGEIFVVDDDFAVRRVLDVLFSSRGYGVTCFAEATSLFAAIQRQSPACIILDVHIPGKSGLEILKELTNLNHPVPVFMISGKGDIAMAVDAIKHGALDFIEKPFGGAEVVTRVEEAIAAERRRVASRSAEPAKFYFPGREPLTAREHEVLTLLVAGATNKEAGRQLGISFRTVEIHRKRIMEKLGARTAGDLVRIALSENRAP